MKNAFFFLPFFAVEKPLARAVTMPTTLGTFGDHRMVFELHTVLRAKVLDFHLSGSQAW